MRRISMVLAGMSVLAISRIAINAAENEDLVNINLHGDLASSDILVTMPDGKKFRAHCHQIHG
ncbi:hypothetical protein KA005_54100 [bacterium]|nr:hypothetical protein [bacterium]